MVLVIWPCCRLGWGSSIPGFFDCSAGRHGFVFGQGLLRCQGGQRKGSIHPFCPAPRFLLAARGLTLLVVVKKGPVKVSKGGKGGKGQKGGKGEAGKGGKSGKGRADAADRADRERCFFCIKFFSSV